MQSSDVLEQIWIKHRDFIKRFLISLTRDIDLADDLLQNTYLKARSGIAAFRGGDARAWLSAIAKNEFYAHVRHRYLRIEEPMTCDHVNDNASFADQITLIEIERALTELSMPLRTALILKHYGGYTYDEIASTMSCPVGTAKRRVNLALKKLRLILEPVFGEPMDAKCIWMANNQILDYVCEKLPESDISAFKRHLCECVLCRDAVEGTSKVLRALDVKESDNKTSQIVDLCLDEDDIQARYVFSSYTNNTDKPVEIHDHTVGCYNLLDYVLVDGEEAYFDDPVPIEGTSAWTYRVHLKRPVLPGERAVIFSVGHVVPKKCVFPIGNGVWRIGPGGLVAQRQLLYMLAVRLPVGARLIHASPESYKLRTNCARSTIVWNDILQSGERFKYHVDYSR
ncbi:MAG: RNA polymerase sigma factor [Armatimonadota bacterium]